MVVASPGEGRAQCRGPREVAYGLTFGTGLGSPEPIDLENARVITLIGPPGFVPTELPWGSKDGLTRPTRTSP